MGPNEEDVQAILGEHHSAIRKVVTDAWSEWRLVEDFRTNRGFSPIQYSRTVANYVFDAIARNAVQAFDDNGAGIRVLVEPQTIKIVFDDMVVGRFKKGDENHLGRNIQTNAVLDYTDAQMPLRGLPPTAAKIDFIYVLNALGTQIEQVLVTARNKNSLVWFYEIEETISQENVVVLPSATPPTDPEGDGLITPKETKKDLNEQGS